MKIETKAKILTAESRPYSFGNNTGTSHKIRLSINGEIYVCKSNEAQIAQLQPLLGSEVSVSLLVTSRREVLGLQLVSVK